MRLKAEVGWFKGEPLAILGIDLLKLERGIGWLTIISVQVLLFCISLSVEFEE